CQQGYTNPLTF
nr:immunoglobulin light chain junction region [Macaca mulatta]MOW41200.1 immunoglobulin light chain junction region [Macaca mulatta]